MEVGRIGIVTEELAHPFQLLHLLSPSLGAVEQCHHGEQSHEDEDRHADPNDLPRRQTPRLGRRRKVDSIGDLRWRTTTWRNSDRLMGLCYRTVMLFIGAERSLR